MRGACALYLLAAMALCRPPGRRAADSQCAPGDTCASDSTGSASVPLTHMFTSPSTFEYLKTRPTLSTDQSGQSKVSASDNQKWLTRADVEQIRAEKASLRTPSDDELEACTIPIIKHRMSFSRFLRKYRDKAAIITREAGYAALPFDIADAGFVANYIPKAQINPCLCRPQHGTNFHDTKAVMDPEALYRKKFCLWQLPLYLKTKFNRTTVELADIVSNPDLVAELPFQCRVTQDGGGATKLLQHVVGNLGNAKGAKSFMPWWGANLNTPSFHSSSLWISTANSRTPLHYDRQHQFLVQLEGRKHVSLVPRATDDGGEVSRLAWEHGGIFNMTTMGRDLVERGFDPEKEVPGGVQTCLLNPGDILWMPPRTPHDIYALDESISMNMRFNELVDVLPKRKRRKRRRPKQD